MEPTREAARLRTAFELFDAGVRLMRARLTRAHPNASAAEIDALVATWLRESDGAPQGDELGRSAPSPPSR